MNEKCFSRNQWLLIIGDSITLFVVTLVGFSNHQTLTTAGTRIFSTFIPWIISWFLIAPLLGVFEDKKTTDFKQLWRPVWAMVLASPFAGFLRAIWLGQEMLPLFPVIMGGSAAIGIILFRLFYIYFRRKQGG
ncbi:MAG: DUF3054 domain-containing protein [Chloroflexi bacterium]|jgi:hypothetical protein|nr:DUF3054 domain-containing protein [Chloroflexota bacterium]MBT3669256.1 DUF3054 domain-containing protein [Chloroflexota bacterium]MBT4003081.1 DUF3054 domain-containing protein [Chloroflexota bacterium]MBT4305963.1 DUF3054 domain-containing protein [Chloroflexota bacterium]MBT4532607.1 DUF3054 domain-containing protein [Chloroflexota bacterium]